MTGLGVCAAPCISVVVPIYNSELSLPILYRRIAESVETSGSWELILVDDASSDGTPEVGQILADFDSRVNYHRLQRNQGQAHATVVGLRLSRGMRVITIDDDLEQPPEWIPRLLEEIDRGYAVAIARFSQITHSPFRRFGSRVARWVWRYLHGARNLTITSFKAFDRGALDVVLAHVTDAAWPLSVVILQTVPAERLINVDVPHGKRMFGHSNYNIVKLAARFRMLIRVASDHRQKMSS